MKKFNEITLDEALMINGGEVRTQEDKPVQINSGFVAAVITAAVCSNPVGAAIFGFGSAYGAYYGK